jgi:hypothetical protein
MKYQPNFNDPRVITRCRRALGWACGVMSESKSHSWSSRYIDEYFGMSTNPLSKYLRNTLLICTDEFYRYNSKDNKCKEYRLNTEGVRSLREALKIDNTQTYPSVIQVAHQDHKQELLSGNFTYNDKSNRLWHPLQRYRKEYRTQILCESGYLHHYDIECCAPRLIHQASQQVPEFVLDGRWLQGPMDLYLFALRKYLNDRNSVRNNVANQINLPVDAVKEIINALFCGAPISKNKDSDIYHILDGDIARIEWLKQDPYIQELVSNIKTCWEYLRPVMSKRTKKTSKGTQRLLPITCKQKWNLYFELERSAMNSIRTYLDEKSIRYFLIHDGWTCDREIDREELREYVRNRTGFDLKFDYEKITNIQTYPSVIQVEITN